MNKPDTMNKHIYFLDSKEDMMQFSTLSTNIGKSVCLNNSIYTLVNSNKSITECSVWKDNNDFYITINKV